MKPSMAPVPTDFRVEFEHHARQHRRKTKHGPDAQIDMSRHDDQHLRHRANQDQGRQQQDDPQAVKGQELGLGKADCQTKQQDHHEDTGFTSQQKLAQPGHAATALRGTAACMMVS